jgi:hypothetical protein
VALPADRAAAAARLRPYFDAQLRFAEAMAAGLGLRRRDAVAEWTNLHRRFGLGNPDPQAPEPLWTDFLDALEATPDHDARLALVTRTYVRCRREPILPGHRVFGCFSYTPPERDDLAGPGTVRIHFVDRDSADGVGPLGAAKQERRRAELAMLIADLRRRHPSARTILGRSWLYHRYAYRRLFPAAYLETAESVEAPLSFRGGSSWGQFQRHDGVDADALARFVARLPELDAQRPERILPLRPLRVTAPIEVFVEDLGAP